MNEQDKKKAIVGGGIMAAAGIAALLLSRRGEGWNFECTPGEVKCIGTDLHTCNGKGQWELAQSNATMCALGDAYFSPFGGVRMPVVTDILIPDVAAFEWHPAGQPAYSHPGGDLVFSNIATFGMMGRSVFSIPEGVPTALQEQFPHAVPLTVEPEGAVISTWETARGESSINYVDRMYIAMLPIDYTCPTYWNSKYELARMIVRHPAIHWETAQSRNPPPLPPNGIYHVPALDLGGAVVAEWINKYGTTCPTCAGTGLWHGNACPDCAGRGLLLLRDTGKGIQDWNWDWRWNVPSFQSHCIANLVPPCTHFVICPYCLQSIEQEADKWSDAQKIDFVSNTFFGHIEQAHPEHPLTQPA